MLLPPFSYHRDLKKIWNFAKRYTKLSKLFSLFWCNYSHLASLVRAYVPVKYFQLDFCSKYALKIVIHLKKKQITFRGRKECVK